MFIDNFQDNWRRASLAERTPYEDLVKILVKKFSAWRSPSPANQMSALKLPSSERFHMKLTDSHPTRAAVTLLRYHRCQLILPWSQTATRSNHADWLCSRKILFLVCFKCICKLFELFSPGSFEEFCITDKWLPVQFFFSRKFLLETF